MNNSSITRDDRLAYVDYFRGARGLAIRSPSHTLLFDESLSPVLQALTLEEILGLHPLTPPSRKALELRRCCGNLQDEARTLGKRTQRCDLPGPTRHSDADCAPLDEKGQRESGTWETVFYRDE
jgi:hypothetical protein